MGYKAAIREPFRWAARNLVGEKYGRLSVVGYYGYEPTQSGPLHYYECKCDCGSDAVVSSRSLLYGKSKSCGCLKRELTGDRARTHGMRRTPEYTTWSTMKARCNNPANSKYGRYGGRGIKVCDRWEDSFEAFLEDMGYRPSDAHSIERKDNDDGYHPENCRWATPAEQALNRSTTHLVEFGGEVMPLADAERSSGLPHSAVAMRLKHGWDAEKALTTPVRQQKAPIKILVDVGGEQFPLKEACRRLGKKYGTVHARITRYGWSPERALSE